MFEMNRLQEDWIREKQTTSIVTSKVFSFSKRLFLNISLSLSIVLFCSSSRMCVRGGSPINMITSKTDLESFPF